MTHPDPFGDLAELRAQLLELVRRADQLGYVITVDTIHTKPVMGAVWMVPDVRPHLGKIRWMMSAGWYEPGWAIDKMRVSVDGKLEWRTIDCVAGSQRQPKLAPDELIRWDIGSDVPYIIKGQQ
jgi:hypothetical protein